MSINLFRDKGTDITNQKFTWRDLVQKPLSKFNDDAFTRLRVILVNGQELEANRFSHMCARMNKDLQAELAVTRRAEQHQATMINWLLGADHSPLETTIAYEQVAIEVTAAVAQKEPDAYLAQVYRFGLLEDFDHMYRYSALMDRLEGKDANNILQSYTDVIPGRPTVLEHRHPHDELRRPYLKGNAEFLTKLHATMIMAAEQQTHNYYMNIGPQFADPTARQLYAEIASIEEQHVTQYESIIDPTETWLEKLLIHEANEIYVYWSCVEAETNPRIKAIWERFLDYELGHLQKAMELFKKFEKRDPAEIIPEKLPSALEFKPQREFVRGVLEKEVGYRYNGNELITDPSLEPQRSLDYRTQLNSEGSPSETVTSGYVYRPGTELTTPAQLQH